MKNRMTPKSLVVTGVALTVASLLLFSLASPSLTIGSETDVPIPGTPKHVQVVVSDSTPAANANVAVNVIVTDDTGSAAPGATCTFGISSQPGNDATIDPGPVTTDSNGNAASTLHTGSTTGTIQILVQCGSASTAVTLTVGAAGTGTTSSPPASLPDSGNGGYTDTVASMKTSLVWLLAGLGIVLAGTGVVAGRIGQRSRNK